jgi:protocatechuate 3,4-dioxygenase beta subunit
MPKTLIVAGCVALALGAALWWALSSGEPRGHELAAAPVAASPAPATTAPTQDTLRPAKQPASAAPSAEPARAPARLSVDAGVAAPTLAFELLVTAPDGGALPGASVRVLASGESGGNGALEDHERIDAFMEEHAQTLVADAAGRVRMEPPGAAGTYVVASAPGLWGSAHLDASAESPYTLELARDATLRARAIDEAGRPLAGAHIELHRKHSSWSWSQDERIADADGLVVFRHVQTTLAPENDESWAVRVAALFPRPIEHELDPRNLPTEVVTLVVPATGGVVVRVRETDGSAPGGPVAVELGIVALGQPRQLSPFGSDRRETVESEVEDGVARFGLVALGQELEVTATRRGARVGTRVYGFGPARAGEERGFDLVLGADHPSVRLRALDEGGTALAETDLELRVDLRSSYTTDWSDVAVETDTAGRFLVDLDRGWVEGGTRTLTVTRPDAGADAPRGVVDLSREFPDGVSDLGDVRLGAAPVFVRGQVVDGQGAPVAEAALLLREQTEQGFALVWDFDHVTDADGRFDVRGTRSADAYELGASKAGLAGPLVPFEPGAEGLLIVLHGAGAIAGRVLVDERVPRDKLSIHLEDEQGLTDHLQYHDRETNPGEDGTFALDQLLPGVYGVYVQLDDESVRLAEVDGIAVTSGATTSDPRLEIDLRGTLFVHRLEFVAPDPAGPLHGELSFGRAGAAEVEHHQTYFQERVHELLTTFEEIDLVVSARGYRVEHLEGVRGSATVHLRRGLPVRIVLRGPARLPEPPLYVKVVLAPADAPYRGIDWGAPSFDETRETLVRAPAAGRMKVHWIVERRGSGSSVASSHELAPEQFVEIRDVDVEQTVEVTLTEEQMAELAGVL